MSQYDTQTPTLRGRLRLGWLRLASWFDDPWTAFLALLVLTILSMGFYLLAHNTIVPDSEPQLCSQIEKNQEPEEQGGTALACKADLKGMYLDKSDVLKFIVDENYLVGQYGAAKVKNVTDQIDDYIDSQRTILINRRYETLRSISVWWTEIEKSNINRKFFVNECVDDTSRNSGECKEAARSRVYIVDASPAPLILNEVVKEEKFPPTSQSLIDLIASQDLNAIKK